MDDGLRKAVTGVMYNITDCRIVVAVFFIITMTFKISSFGATPSDREFECTFTTDVRRPQADCASWRTTKG
jgi:hypothetical protein